MMKFNQLTPELSVTDFQKSLGFYTQILGFSIEYQRAEEGFARLALGEAQLMIDQIGKGRIWQTGEFSYPLGRGINLEIEVPNIDPILTSLKKHQIKPFMEVEEKWYRQDTLELGNRQFLVQDPDGYLLRFTQDLGSRKFQATKSH